MYKSTLNLSSVKNETFHLLNTIYLSETEIDNYHNSARHFLLYITACGIYKMDQRLYRDLISLWEAGKLKWGVMVIIFELKTNRVHICVNLD